MTTVEDIMRPIQQKFWKRVAIGDQNECWPFMGTVTPQGYGIAILPGTKDRRMGAHRLAYIYHHGFIDDDLVVDHLCRNPICCNPHHLESVTQRENALRGIGPAAVHAKKTHCIRGHEFTPENTACNGKGRKCRTCQREYTKTYVKKSRRASSHA